MTSPLRAWQWFVIGVSLSLTLLSAFYLGRLSVKPVVSVCAMGRSIMGAQR